MLSDSLFETHLELEKTLYHYTSEAFKNTYDNEVILEVQDILNRLDRLRWKIDCDSFVGTARYDKPTLGNPPTVHEPDAHRFDLKSKETLQEQIEFLTDYYFKHENKFSVYANSHTFQRIRKEIPLLKFETKKCEAYFEDATLFTHPEWIEDDQIIITARTV